MKKQKCPYCGKKVYKCISLGVVRYLEIDNSPKSARMHSCETQVDKKDENK